MCFSWGKGRHYDDFYEKTFNEITSKFEVFDHHTLDPGWKKEWSQVCWDRGLLSTWFKEEYAVRILPGNRILTIIKSWMIWFLKEEHWTINKTTRKQKTGTVIIKKIKNKLRATINQFKNDNHKSWSLTTLKSSPTLESQTTKLNSIVRSDNPMVMVQSKLYSTIDFASWPLHYENTQSR